MDRRTAANSLIRKVPTYECRNCHRQLLGKLKHELPGHHSAWNQRHTLVPSLNRLPVAGSDWPDAAALPTDHCPTVQIDFHGARLRRRAKRARRGGFDDLLDGHWRCGKYAAHAEPAHRTAW